MRIAPIVFVVLLALCATLAWVWVTPQPPMAAGQQHPEFSTMIHGGDGWARHRDILVPGTFFGLLSITLYVALMALGLARGGRLRNGAAALGVGWLLFLGVFLAVVLSYRGYATAGSERLVLGFPPPTAWMLYGIYLFPVFFLALYVLRFDEWVMSSDELASFHRLVEERRAIEAQPTSGTAEGSR